MVAWRGVERLHYRQAHHGGSPCSREFMICKPVLVPRTEPEHWDTSDIQQDFCTKEKWPRLVILTEILEGAPNCSRLVELEAAPKFSASSAWTAFA